MSLFQQSVLKKYLNDINNNSLIVAWKKFNSYFKNVEKQQNIRNSKEEQYQEGFLRELFVDVLGYTLNPDPKFNITTELKNEKDSKKADGAILNGEQVMAVIELKGTDTTDLAKVEQQAFGYKNNHKDCTYVIISNFEKLRFYIANTVDFEEFHLFTLSLERFSLLFLCLQKDNLLSNLPLSIKQASIAVEENVTKQLYADYSLFKKQLFNNIVSLNPQFDKLLLFKKTQKLLDRFLFIFFAEDRLLLPPNLIRIVLDDWEKLKELDEYKPLYERIKKYFVYLNKGYTSKGYEIFAYNGGLFAADEVLDSIIIDDEILYSNCVTLSNYNFDTEVDVNILGHIFEHSLNEIEELQAEIDGSAIDKTKTKRKKDGVFYTPRYITKYIVENTVGILCENKKNELKIVAEEFTPDKRKANKRKLIEQIDAYREWLLQLTICDPACGSGAFLNQALDFLLAEHAYIDELIAKLQGASIIYSDVEKSILENNLFGVDINEEAVDIARLSLWLRTAHKGRKLNNLSNNIKCGNSLIDDPSIAGDKAFNWQEEFPHIFKQKETRAYHLVFTTHNSRTSQRMIEQNVVKGEPLELNLEQEIVITDIIGKIIIENKYRCIAYNICKDHVHLVLVCAEDELNETVKTLKGKSAYLFNKSLSNGLKPIGNVENKLSTDEYKPIGDKAEQISNGFQPIAEKETTNHHGHLWSQKFFRAFLDEWELMTVSSKPGWVYNDGYLTNAINYVRGNREKHGLKYSKKLNDIIASFCMDTEKAFEQQYSGGFDVVIGNPPYVPAEFICKSDKMYLELHYNSAFGRINLFPIFYEKAINISITNGRIGFITPYTLLKNQYFINSRKFILENTSIDCIVDFKGISVFPDAAVDAIILILRVSKIQNKNVKVIDSIVDFSMRLYKEYHIQQASFSARNDFSFEISNSELNIEKLRKNTLILCDIINFKQGIITGDNKKMLTNKPSEKTQKVITGSDFNRYSINWNNNYVIYDPELLHRARKKEIFEVPQKILLRQTSSYPICTLDKNQYYTLDTVHNGVIVDSSYDILYLLCLINSKLLRYLYINSINEEGKVFAQVKIIYVDPLPIKKLAKIDQRPFIEKADIMLSKNKELQETTKHFLQLLQSKFAGLSINNKLEKYYTLSFTDFINELGKQKMKLSLQQESDWLTFFEEEKQKACAIKTVIDTTDNQIDEMVYKLYGLTEEEIKIVEG